MKPIRRMTIVDAFFVLVLVGLTIAFYRVLAPFVIDIFLAFILANIFWRVFAFFRRLFNRKKGLASLVTVLLILIVLGGILAFLIIIIKNEISGGVESLRVWWPEMKDQLKGVEVGGFLSRLPFLQDISPNTGPVELNKILETILSRSSTFLMQLASKSFTSLSNFILHLVFTFFILFFVFIDGKKLVARVKSLIPLSNQDTDELTKEVAVMTRATVVSTLIIGFIEGTFGGIIFAVFRLPSPVLWGVIILFMSLIPIIGANVVLVPAGIITIISGRYFAGGAIIALGLAGIATTQNIIKPKLLGGRSGLHPMIVLLSTLGGIAWLGLIGFLIGPMIAALFIVIWKQFGKRFHAELQSKNEDPE
jgi:predicted PurR-regulated permease PerM